MNNEWKTEWINRLMKNWMWMKNWTKERLNELIDEWKTE